MAIQAVAKSTNRAPKGTAKKNNTPKVKGTKKTSSIASQRTSRLQSKKSSPRHPRSIVRANLGPQSDTEIRAFVPDLFNRNKKRSSGILGKVEGVISNLQKKRRLVMYAGEATYPLLFPYAAIAVLSLISLVANYLIGDGTLKEAITALTPINSWIFLSQAVAASIGIICVMITYLGLAVTRTNIFNGRVLMPFFVAICFYVGCLVLPILGLFPVLIIWLWLVVFIY